MYDYEYLNQIFSENPLPSNLRLKDNYAFAFFRRILFEKALSVFEFTNFPEEWDLNFWETCLYGRGYLAVINTRKFGFIPQPCTLSEYNIFYQPRKVLIANTYLPAENNRSYTIFKDCRLLRLRPNLDSIIPIVDYYAAKLAITTQSLDVNVINSKTTVIFEVAGKGQAATIKKAYDEAASGEPVVVLNKGIAKGAGESIISDSFSGKNYLGDKLYDLFTKFENEFNSRVGIPGVDAEKKERMISSEVEASTADTSALAKVIQTTLETDLKKINEFAGTNIGVKYAYEQEPAPDPKEEPSNDE